MKSIMEYVNASDEIKKKYMSLASEDSIVKELMKWYDENKSSSDKHSSYYCGIAKDPVERKGQHESQDHDGKAIKKMIAIKCKDLTTSGNVEEKIGAAGFDIGDPNHWANGGTEDSIWVYLYKKP